MDKKTIKTFVIGSALLLFAAVIFLGIESHGRLAETKFGVIAILAIALLLFLAAFLSREEKPSSRSKSDVNKEPPIDV
jgi:membrane protein implicated in regulation of membrane protease activity